MRDAISWNGISLGAELIAVALLIGGFIVSMGSEVIDASLSGQVRRLGLALARVS